MEIRADIGPIEAVRRFITANPTGTKAQLIEQLGETYNHGTLSTQFAKQSREIAAKLAPAQPVDKISRTRWFDTITDALNDTPVPHGWRIEANEINISSNKVRIEFVLAKQHKEDDDMDIRDIDFDAIKANFTPATETADAIGAFDACDAFNFRVKDMSIGRRIQTIVSRIGVKEHTARCQTIRYYMATVVRGMTGDGIKTEMTRSGKYSSHVGVDTKGVDGPAESIPNLNIVF